MWYCTSCGAGNEENYRFCVACGQPRPIQVFTPAEEPWAAAPQPKRKSRWWLWLILALAVLAAAAVICFFTIHRWTPATCTEPETCSICGRTRGEALGHDAAPATCTEPSVCARCGETVQEALGHDWLDATYERAETCARCGETRGQVKGYVGDLYGSMADEELNLYGISLSHPYELTRTVRNGLRMTLYLQLTDVTGDPYGSWGLYGRDPQGNWNLLTTFYVAHTAYNNYVSYDLELDGRQSFDALSLVPFISTDYTLSFSFYFEDVQEYVD